MALLEELQHTINSLSEFKEIAKRVLNYIPEVTSTTKEDKGYVIIHSIQASSKKYARPYKKDLFISSPDDFESMYLNLLEILQKSKDDCNSFSSDDFEIVDKVTYTIQQSFGIALDLLGNQNANRKHVGNRFEDLISLLVSQIGVNNEKIILKIPYNDNGIYSCETDFVYTPHEKVRSNNSTIDENEVVVSLKTSSKDRMGRIFIDKILMSKFVERDVKVIGIFLNDIQRKEEEKVSYTFVAGLFMVYTKFLTELDGVYFVDPPPNALKEPYNKHIKKFSQFLLVDAKKFLTSTT